MSVPIFFMITGYFLYTDDDTILYKRAIKTAKKAFIIFIICNIIYFPFIDNIDLPSKENYVMYIRWFVFGWGPSSSHLWYIMSLIQSMIVIAFFSKFKLSKYLFFFTLCFAINFYVKDSLFNANFIFKGLPCISLGMLISKYRDYFIKFKNYNVVLISSILLLYFTHFLIPVNILQRTLMLIFTNSILVSSFILCLQNAQFGKGSFIERIGERYSGNIYYLHYIPIFILSQYITSYHYNNWGLLYVTLVSLLLAISVVELQNKFKINILR